MRTQKHKAKTKKIKKLLIDLEIKQKSLGDAIGVSKRMICFVIHGDRLCWPIRQKIADFLKVPISSIFPDDSRSKAV